MMLNIILWKLPSPHGEFSVMCSSSNIAYPHLMFWFTNKKIIGVGSSEVHCSKSIENEG